MDILRVVNRDVISFVNSVFFLTMNDEGLDSVATESEYDKKTRIRSIRITQIMSFIFALGFSSVITGIYPYLQEVSL